MEITLFTINNSRTELNLAISNATAATTLYLWTDKTYKDYSKAIDLSAKLNGIATQNIVITLNELKQKYFDGLYFVELSSSAELDSSFTGDLTRYKECILDKIVSLSMCDSCLNKESGAIINAQGLLTSLETAIELGFLDESFNIITALNKYCSNDCATCGAYSDVKDENYFNIPVDPKAATSVMAFVIPNDSSTNGVLLEIFDDGDLIYAQEFHQDFTGYKTITFEAGKEYTFQTTHPNHPGNTRVVDLYFYTGNDFEDQVTIDSNPFTINSSDYSKSVAYFNSETSYPYDYPILGVGSLAT